MVACCELEEWRKDVSFVCGGGVEAVGGGAYILASIPAGYNMFHLRAVHGKKRHCLLEFLLNVRTQTTVLASRRARH